MTQTNLAETLLLAEQLFDQDQLDRAEALATDVLKQNTAQPRALQVLGMIKSRRDLPAEAIPLLERALSICPDLAPSHNDLGLSYDQLGNADLALEHFEKALLLQPDHALAHLNRSLSNLKFGRFHEGWIEYEWRFRSGSVSSPQIPVPRWDGAPLKGKGLLIHTEQGMGDVLQFIRFIPLLKRQGAHVALACQKALQPLLQSFPGIDEWIPIDEPTEITFDYYAPLLSLPALLKIDREEDIPRRVPYVHADPERIERWRDRLQQIESGKKPFRIGVAWQGSQTFRGDRLRSIPLRFFAPIAQLDNVHLVSLQKGFGTEQIADVANRIPLTVWEDLDETGAFVDTAALMRSLDLVISSDTAIAHLAGALGRPTWIALSTAADWRWHLDRDDSPWYPSVRLFRQPDLGNWGSIFLEMADKLLPQTIL